MPKSFRLIQTTLVCLFLIASTDRNALAQWHRQNLPGMDLSNLWVPLGIMTTGAIIAIAIPTPSPELNLERAAISPENTSLRSFKKPIRIKEKKRTDYGSIKSMGDSALVLATRGEDITARFSDVKEIMDLESAAKRAKRKNVGMGIFWFSVATAFTYEGVSSSEDGKEAILIPGIGFLGLAIYSFAEKSEEERELEAWQKSGGQLHAKHQSTLLDRLDCHVYAASVGGMYNAGKRTSIGAVPSVGISLALGL